MQLHLFRIFDIDNSQPLGTRGNISVGTRDVEALCVGERNNVVLYERRVFRVRDVNYFHALAIADKKIAELECCRAPVVEWNGLHNTGRHRIIQIDYDQSGVGDDIGVVTAQGDVTCTIENAILVPCQRALQEVIAQFTVGQGVDVGQDQSFLRVHYQDVVVDGMERLLEIVFSHQLTLVSNRVYWLIGGQHEAGRIGSFYSRVVAQWAEWCGDDALTDPLVGNACNIVGAHALAAFRYVEVFAT